MLSFLRITAVWRAAHATGRKPPSPIHPAPRVPLPRARPAITLRSRRYTQRDRFRVGDTATGVSRGAGVLRAGYLGPSPAGDPVARSAAVIALRNSIATVVGPTPPTLGVMAPATRAQDSSTSGSRRLPS